MKPTDYWAGVEAGMKIALHDLPDGVSAVLYAHLCSCVTSENRLGQGIVRAPWTDPREISRWTGLSLEEVRIDLRRLGAAGLIDVGQTGRLPSIIRVKRART